MRPHALAVLVCAAAALCASALPAPPLNPAALADATAADRVDAAGLAVGPAVPGVAAAAAAAADVAARAAPPLGPDAVEEAPGGEPAAAAGPAAAAARARATRRARWPAAPGPTRAPVRAQGAAAAPPAAATKPPSPTDKKGDAAPDAGRESGDDGPPFNPAFPSPAGRGVARSGGRAGTLSLAASLPDLYVASAGGRGLSPAAAKAAAAKPPLSFAARWSGAASARVAGFYDDMQAAENETPDPRRESLLIAGIDPAKPNRLGARLDDVPVARSIPVEVLPSAPSPADGLAASRTVIRGGSPPASLAFAAGAAVDQPTRRFRPPDQALCVGGGVAITGNNLVFRSWNATTGDPVDGPIDVPSFFGLTGNFSDPGCIFDHSDSRRFFLSIFRFNEAPVGKYSQYIVAVSKTSNPGDGFWGPYIFRNDGLDAAGAAPLPGLEKCRATKGTDGDPDMDAGCLGDYPSVGIDAHSLWSGFNLFKADDGYAGSLMLAISKPDLVSGAASVPAHAVYSNWNQELSYTVQPSVTQAGTPHDAARGGTIYFVSTAPVVQNEPNVPALATWAATGTSKLAAPDFPKAGIPVISACALLDTPAYRDPGVFKARRLGVVQPAPGFPLDGGDARTLQHVLSGGVLWTATQTVMYVGSTAANLTIGPTYFAVLPAFSAAGAYTPRLVAAGYVGVAGRFIGRPAITATKGGTAYIAAYMSGADFTMSPVVAEVDLLTGPRRVIVPVRSPGPLQPSTVDRLWKAGDFGGGGTLRVGDYSAATLDEAGHAWLASEWSGGVPSPLCADAYGPTKCPNWSTFVTRIDLGAATGPTAAARAPPAAQGAESESDEGDAAPAAAAAAVDVAVGGAQGPPAPGSSLDRFGPVYYRPDDTLERESERERERRG